MPVYDGLLMRDSTTDTGVVPSPGYPYYSPDVIAHAQVADPQTFFVSNYSTNPNQPVQLGSHINLIYVRTKNLSTTVKSGWFIHVYRASSSLFMTPSIWLGNKLTTASGNDYVTLGAAQPNQVIVGNDNFILDAITSNLFCLIGVASATQTPSIPASFSSYTAYVDWVRQNQNVCGNNLTLLRSYPNRSYERTDSFSNPESDSVPVLIKVTASGLSGGTTFGLQCAPLKINVSQTVSQGDTLTGSGMAPPHFSGTVTTFGTLPSGETKWPVGARLDTTVYVGREASDELAAKYAEDTSKLGIDFDEHELFSPEGVLIRVGDVATEFVAQSGYSSYSR